MNDSVLNNHFHHIACWKPPAFRNQFSEVIFTGCHVENELPFNTSRPRQDGRRFPDDTFECIFLNKNVIILIKISLKFVPNGSINNIPALVQIMAWRRPGDKPVSEPMMVRLLTHICVTQPQWVKTNCLSSFYPLVHFPIAALHRWFQHRQCTERTLQICHTLQLRGKNQCEIDIFISNKI